jgi:hypothetical protein
MPPVRFQDRAGLTEDRLHRSDRAKNFVTRFMTETALLPLRVVPHIEPLAHKPIAQAVWQQ